MDKEFKKTDELLRLLEIRGIVFDTPAEKGNAKKAIQHYGYYNLINGYNKIFLESKDPQDRYKTGTKVSDIVALYKLDKKMRDILFKHILTVETNTKALIAYVFSKEYGHENYLVFTNFNINIKNAERNITSIISDIHHQISYRSNDPAISHYLSKYGYIPLWVVNNILTFGQISKFYAVMKQPDRQQISKVFHVSDKEFESILYYLSGVRNFCAHGNRLYCYRSKKPLTDLSIHKAIDIPRGNGNEYAYGKRDLFACLLALYYVLPKNDYRRLLKELGNAISSVRKRNSSVLTESDLLHELGFPENWLTILQSPLNLINFVNY